MYKFPGDYVMTYDQDFIEQHDDSSDFEEACIPVATKTGKHSLVNQQRKKQRNKLRKKNNTMYIDCDEYPVKLKNDNQTFSQIDKATQSKHIITSNKKAKCKSTRRDQNGGDQIHPVKSKVSILRHKIIPCISCISSIFKRSNYYSKNQLPLIEENQNENVHTNNCGQRCSNCGHKRMRKLYRRQNYAVEPVYAIEGNGHKTTGPFYSEKITEPLQNHNRKKPKNLYSSYFSPSLSSDSECQYEKERQNKIKKFKKRLKTKILREHLKYQQNHNFKAQMQQYPSKDRKNPCHVFPTLFQSRSNIFPDSCSSDMATTSSSFWQHLFEKNCKINNNHRTEMKTCMCSCSQKRDSENDYYSKKVEAKQQTSFSKPAIPYQDQNPQSNISDLINTNEATFSATNGTMTLHCEEWCTGNTTGDNILKGGEPLASLNKNLNKEVKEKVKCNCYKKDQQQNFPSKQTQKTEKIPCQENHDVIAASLKEMYNREIICIHKPPCILINGCLNFLPQQEDAQMTVYPVAESGKNPLYNSKKERANREQSCQYHVSCIELNKNQTGDTAEKKIQSICNHDPPCEVVRGCYKPKYDPTLYNPCIHVPMCEKIPKCVFGKIEGKRCEHRPRCQDLPMCSKKYAIMTARENIGTQARESFTCRHEPHCIKIPKCLRRAMCGSLVSLDAIPDCIHQPPCTLVPACCRKSAKEMVSVSSQYPNSCRIV